MFFNEKREKDILNKLCCDKLNDLKLKIIELKEESKEERINKHYDVLKYNMRDLLNEVFAISSLLDKNKKTKELLNLETELKNLIKEFIDRIEKIGKNIKTEILKELSQIDMPIFNFDNHIEEIEHDRIRATLRKVVDKLELQSIELEETVEKGFINYKNQDFYIQGKISYSIISHRQVISYANCMNCLINKDAREAIHYLSEFVDNYQYNNTEPFNSYERISMKNMITGILKILDK